MKKNFLALLFSIMFFLQTTASVKDSVKFKKLVIKKYCISYKKGESNPFMGIAYKNYLGGRAKRTVPYEYGIAEGKAINYYRNKKIESEELFKNGSIQSTTRYYKSGNKKSITNYINGSYENYTTIAYKENGLKNYEYTVVNGNYGGVYKSYQENGRLWVTGFYDNGKKVGEWIYYDENGKVDYKEHYVNGKKEYYN